MTSSEVRNRKYITYRNAVRGGTIHGHKQHAQKFGKVRMFQFNFKVFVPTDPLPTSFYGR